MAYNFDLIPNRRNPNVLNKWTIYPKDVLPMWVADMDFPAPRPILEELHKTVEHGVLGYELLSKALQETVAARMNHLYGWKVKPEAVVATTGVVNEFHEVKNNVGIPQIDAPLVKSVSDNVLHYEIDWGVFKKQVKKAGIFLLCNPHNPLGINFSRKDLLRMAEICIENNVLIVSDEIHSELLLDDQKFTPLAKLSSEIAKHTITLIAPSKTFNVPGLFCGFASFPIKSFAKDI